MRPSAFGRATTEWNFYFVYSQLLCSCMLVQSRTWIEVMLMSLKDPVARSVGEFHAVICLSIVPDIKVRYMGNEPKRSPPKKPGH